MFAVSTFGGELYGSVIKSTHITAQTATFTSNPALPATFRIQNERNELLGATFRVANNADTFLVSKFRIKLRPGTIRSAVISITPISLDIDGENKATSI